ncbi:acyltransferase family protein [Flavobacterium branchiicola]|uniref:Acyltransferase n=1 Tax=Flavobacterium branchiicola TaxID=1114875 RepID=A0ABV9PA42_9FLAO|nr:acyltransferase [Flavobacterium branchiicola]MBS7252489.1 acyltransferase [Flavobacterium branchiicola]
MSATISTSGSSNKLVYIDNIKIILTILVILHHTVIAYGGSGGWYYTDKTTCFGALVPMTMFVSINQSFFMGFFFLLVAYFTDSSYFKKGTSQFIKDRLVRLGIPLLFYSFVLSPIISYLVYYFEKGHPITFLEYLFGYDSWIDFGVMWFVAALLVFTMLYVLVQKFFKTASNTILPAPKACKIIAFAVVLGIISFVVRIVFPVGWVLEPVGFQLGHFSQYIALFIIGIIAFRNNWLEQITEQTRKRLSLSIVLCLLFFPVFFVIHAKLKMPIEWYSGGFHWQSLLYAVWEQLIGISILTVFLIKGRRSWNTSSAMLTKVSRISFATYIFHPVIVVSLTLMVRNWTIDPALKFLVIAPFAVLGSFVFAALILVIPGVKKII